MVLRSPLQKGEIFSSNFSNQKIFFMFFFFAQKEKKKKTLRKKIEISFFQQESHKKGKKIPILFHLLKIGGPKF